LILRLCAVAVSLAALALSGAGCGEPASGVQTANVGAGAPPQPPAKPFPEAESAWGAYRSLRFALTIPLPDEPTWKVDDHSRAELVAAQGSTRSGLVLLEETEPSLMNHKGCEARARARGLVPARTLRTIEDLVTVGPEAFDTRVVVAVESRGPDGPLEGHVFAFGAYVRKCLFVHLSTEVASPGDEAVLSQRLALGRVRTLGGIRMDALGEVPREKPRD
jgi:hypothetical protein